MESNDYVLFQQLKWHYVFGISNMVSAAEFPSSLSHFVRSLPYGNDHSSAYSCKVDEEIRMKFFFFFIYLQEVWSIPH